MFRSYNNEYYRHDDVDDDFDDDFDDDDDFKINVVIYSADLKLKITTQRQKLLENRLFFIMPHVNCISIRHERMQTRVRACQNTTKH